MNSYARGSRRRMLSAAAVSALGVVLFPPSVSHIWKLDEPIAGVIFSAITTTLAIGLMYAGYWLLDSDVSDEQCSKVFGWTLGGTIVISAVLGLMITYQLAEGAEVEDPVFFMAGTVTLGAVGGFLIGTYDARRVHAEQLVAEQQKADLFNKILRHNVLNAMNIVRGRAELLEPHVDEDGQRYLDVVLDWSASVADLTRKVRSLLEMVGEGDIDLEPTDLSEVISAQVSKAQATYEDAEFVTSEEFPSEAYVEANGMLPEVLDNLLENAVKHNDKEHPEVRVELRENGEAFLATVKDNGPGIPDGQKESVFGRKDANPGDSGIGIGLFLTDQFVDLYGGDIWVEDSENGGSVFKIKLPRANAA